MEKIHLDAIDRKILNMLQTDCTLSVADIGEAVGLSATPCWKRIKRLERDGVIERRIAVLNREKLGLGITVIVAVKTSSHSEAWLEAFAKGVSLIPEVLEFYRMSGDIDYLLKVVAHDIGDYDRIYRKLTRVAELFDVSSSFAMQEIKSTSALPLFG